MIMEGFADDWPLERKRSNSSPNLLGLAGDTPLGSDASGDCVGSGASGASGAFGAFGASGGSAGSKGSGASDVSSMDKAMHIPYDTLMEAARSMERLHVELENREQVIRELVELRARDKNEFELQVNVLQGQLLAERSRVRMLVQRCDQDEKLRAMNLVRSPSEGTGSFGSAGNKHRVVTGGVTVLNDALWNNSKTRTPNDLFPLDHGDFMI